MRSTRKVLGRTELLAMAGIKEVEWPNGWYLHAEPEPHVSPKPPRAAKRGRKR